MADWQVAASLRGCGEVVSVRFHRAAEGAAIARFQHPSGAAAALRCGELNLLGQRVFLSPHWCEAHYHLWAGHCSQAAPPPSGRTGGPGGEMGGPGGGMEMGGWGDPQSGKWRSHDGSGRFIHHHPNMPDASGATGDWKCDKCGNLNFAHRIRCNRCHVEPPTTFGQGRRPTPNRCPYTIMLSPADRSKR